MNMNSYKRCVCGGNHKAENIPDMSPVTARQLKIVSVPSKMAMLFILSKAPHCVCDLMTHTKLSQTLISHHLSDLADADLVMGEKNGAFVDYSLTDKGRRLVDVIQKLAQ